MHYDFVFINTRGVDFFVGRLKQNIPLYFLLKVRSFFFRSNWSGDILLCILSFILMGRNSRLGEHFYLVSCKRSLYLRQCIVNSFEWTIVAVHLVEKRNIHPTCSPLKRNMKNRWWLKLFNNLAWLYSPAWSVKDIHIKTIISGH